MLRKRRSASDLGRNRSSVDDSLEAAAHHRGSPQFAGQHVQVRLNLNLDATFVNLIKYNFCYAVSEDFLQQRPFKNALNKHF